MQDGSITDLSSKVARSRKEKPRIKSELRYIYKPKYLWNLNGFSISARKNVVFKSVVDCTVA